MLLIRLFYFEGRSVRPFRRSHQAVRVIIIKKPQELPAELITPFSVVSFSSLFHLFIHKPVQVRYIINVFPEDPQPQKGLLHGAMGVEVFADITGGPVGIQAVETAVKIGQSGLISVS
ncbi:hypothetical protein D9M70_554990 [compost metagenome]